jgi:hypothetical protein
MLRSLLLASTALVVVACAPSAPPEATKPAAPKDYVYRDNGVQASFFTAPCVQQLEDSLADGSHLTATRIAASDDHRAHIITKLELTQAGAYDCDESMNGIVDRMLDELGCTAMQNANVIKSGLPTREVAFRCETRPMRGALRVMCDTREIQNGTVRAYALLSAYDPARWNPKESDAFFAGFKMDPVKVDPVRQ